MNKLVIKLQIYNYILLYQSVYYYNIYIYIFAFLIKNNRINNKNNKKIKIFTTYRII